MNFHPGRIPGTRLWFANLFREIADRFIHPLPEELSCQREELPDPGELVCLAIDNCYLSSVYGLKDFVGMCRKDGLKSEHLFVAVGGILKECESKGFYQLPYADTKVRACQLVADILEREYRAECLDTACASSSGDSGSQFLVGDTCTFMTTDLCKELEISSKTLAKYVVSAGVRPTRRGERNRRYTSAEREKILRVFADKAPCDIASKAREKLGEIEIKSKARN